MSETFADKCAYWRRHGLQVAARGITPDYRERPAGQGRRLIQETETGATAMDHPDGRRDVTVRPQPLDVHTDIPVDRIKIGVR